MKQTMKTSLTLALALLLSVCLIACDSVEKTGLWENATYHKDMEFGNGAVTVQVEVKAEEQSITFTVHTDKTTLADALLEHSLIAGEDSAYGLYVKVVNGMTADYDADKSYWSISKNGEMLLTGVSSTALADGEHYEFTYTK